MLTAMLGCKSSSTGNDGGGGADLGPAPCVTNPQSGNDILNGCTDAQTGDPAKDSPYHPSLAPNGMLPPLN
jgi:hypothetical protein